jgi:S-DNA-T family DNA segregation ATPase FtsK/SpoIIIE
LQRRLRIGHPRAARLMQIMEEMGIVGPPEAAGRTRRVIIGDDE